MKTCTRCDGTGFINTHQIPQDVMIKLKKLDYFVAGVLTWIREHGEDYDVRICDCCGNGRYWYGVPGEHYNTEDPQGYHGPYAYNGGMCECH